MFDGKKLRVVDTSEVPRYSKPIIVTLSGLPGCGKSTIARKLSRDLKIYLLSNDFVRNYYQSTRSCTEKERLQIQKKVILINIVRLLKLLLSNTSFVYDRDFNKRNDFIIFNHLINYDLIKIKINSTDSDNISRIESRVLDYGEKIDGVIGDNLMYSSIYDNKSYQEVKARKPQLLDNYFFDYVINNDSSEKKFINDINEVIQDIKCRKLKK